MINPERVISDKKTTLFPITPGVFLVVTSTLCLISWSKGEQVLNNFGIYGWRFNFEYMIRCQGLILVLLLSYLVGKSQLLVGKRRKSFKSANWDFVKVHQLGKRIAFIGIIIHLIWFLYSFLIVGTDVGRKLATIPGFTTLTQCLPVGIACMYLSKKKNQALKWGKWLGISILVVGLRAILNSERLALLELLIPLAVIYIYFEQGIQLKQKLVLGVGTFFSAYALFYALEYFRSWDYYKFRWTGSYSSFINDRIGLYYVTSWNNGVVYSQYSQDAGSAGGAFFAFITEFPLIQAVFNTPLIQGNAFSTWYSTLRSAVGTPEFNNPNYLIVTFTDLTYAGAILWFALVGIVLGKLVKESQRNNLMALLVYACTVIALVDLPRVGWWTSTRSVPVYLALIVIYFSKLDKVQSGSTEVK
jgi:oligosaccharide repeat unit polymerase